MGDVGATGQSQPEPGRVVIVGGGVAALEALVALREFLGSSVMIDLVAPSKEFVYRPLAVAGAFGDGEPPRFALAGIAADHDAVLHQDRVHTVEHEQRLVRLGAGGSLSYDALLIATGARPREWLPGALVFRGPEDVQAMRAVVARLERGDLQSIAFVAPKARSWTLPLYELAFLTAARVGELRLADVQLTIVTPEPVPLEVFGTAATRHVRELCANRGIALRTRARALSYEDGRLALDDGEQVAMEQVVAMPELEGDPIDGVPCDENGFIAADEHGAVPGLVGVYAAGDGADYPIKQGGLATQEADAAAEAIAAQLDSAFVAKVDEPMTLRGQMLTGLAPAYLSVGAPESHAQASSIAFDPADQPVGKIVGRYLPAYLAKLMSSGASG